MPRSHHRADTPPFDPPVHAPRGRLRTRSDHELNQTPAPDQSRDNANPQMSPPPRAPSRLHAVAVVLRPDACPRRTTAAATPPDGSFRRLGMCHERHVPFQPRVPQRGLGLEGLGWAAQGLAKARVRMTQGSARPVSMPPSRCNRRAGSSPVFPPLHCIAEALGWTLAMRNAPSAKQSA